MSRNQSISHRSKCKSAAKKTHDLGVRFLAFFASSLAACFTAICIWGPIDPVVVMIIGVKLPLSTWLTRCSYSSFRVLAMLLKQPSMALELYLDANGLKSLSL